MAKGEPKIPLYNDTNFINYTWVKIVHKPASGPSSCFVRRRADLTCIEIRTERIHFQLVQRQFIEFLYKLFRKYLSPINSSNDLCHTYAFLPLFYAIFVFITFNTNLVVPSFHTIWKKVYRCNWMKLKFQKGWTLFFPINFKAKQFAHWVILIGRFGTEKTVLRIRIRIIFYVLRHRLLPTLLRRVNDTHVYAFLRQLRIYLPMYEGIYYKSHAFTESRIRW